MSVAVRVGHTPDREAALTVWARASEARNGSAVEAATADKVRSRFALPDFWFLVAEDDGAVVGVTSGMTAREEDGSGPEIPGLCHLGMVFVDPQLWGRGIGGALLGAALQHARDTGSSAIQLWTHEDNTRAHRLYRRHGFIPTGRQILDDRDEQIGHWHRDL